MGTTLRRLGHLDHTHRPANLWTVARLGLLLAALLLAGCNGLVPVPGSTVNPTATEAVTPTPEPEPTPVPALPQGPYPPAVLEFSPRLGEEVTTETAMTWRFDQPMDRESVEGGLTFSPEVEGDLIWDGDATVTFQPKTLATATRYQVRLGSEVRSQAGMSLTQELVFAFSTLSPLAVTRVSPEDGAGDLRADTPIYITFNRAVVPVNCVGLPAQTNGACAQLPLTLTPEVMGQGFWLTTSIYRFTPLVGWRAGQVYDVTLDEAVTSVEGARLTSTFAWSFETALPRIVAIEPENGAESVALDAAIRVRFNTPMDQTATGTAFGVTTASGAVVPGTVSWEDQGALLVFSPTARLEIGTPYQVSVGERARAVTSAPLETPLSWRFETVVAPALSSYSPDDGEGGVGLYQPLRLTFAGAIDEATLEAYVQVSPTSDPASVYGYYDPGSGVYHLSWDREPRTEYCVSVLGGVADIYGNTLAPVDDTPDGDSSEDDAAGTPVETFCFVTGDLPAVLDLAQPLTAVSLDASEDSVIYFAVRNLARMDFTLSEIDAPTLMSREAGDGDVIRSWRETFDTPLNEAGVVPVSLRRLGGALPTGLYRLSWSMPGERTFRRQVNIAVVDRHVMVKLAFDETLIWVTDLRSGQPVTRTAVQLIDQDGLLIAGGTTDDDGVARFPISPLENLWQDVAAIVGEPEAEGFGFSLTTWQGRADPWTMGINVEGAPAAPYNLFLQSDRPIYRPGQSVHLYGVLRQDDDVTYMLPQPGTTLTLTLRNPNGMQILTRTLVTSERGSFEDTILLGEDALAGYYVLETQAQAPNGDANGGQPYRLRGLTFTVAAYRKPEFGVEVMADYHEVVQGGQARFLIQTDYFSGAAVSEGQVDWSIWAKPTTFEPSLAAGRTAWRWGTMVPWKAPVLVAEGTTSTDAAGRAVVELPAELAAPEGTDLSQSQRWTLEATVTDETGNPVSGRGDVTVHQAELYLGLRPETWVVAARDRVVVEVAAQDWFYAGVGDLEVNLTLAQRTYFEMPETSTWGYTDTVVSEQVLRTDVDGGGTIAFVPPSSGSYVIIAEAEDGAGRLARAEAHIWVSGSDVVRWRGGDDVLDLVADAQTYEVGETARVLIPTAFEGPYEVLLTVERGGVLAARRYEFETPNPVIDLPVVETYVPNVYVSVVLVRPATETSPPDIRMGYTELRVKPVSRLLDVDLVMGQDTYGPGDTVDLTIRTTDYQGAPADAEIGLAVVDKAVLSLQEENVPPIDEVFYGPRPLRVQTGDVLLMSMERVGARLEDVIDDVDRLLNLAGPAGMGGGAAEAGVATRSEFPDTAYWRAQLQTGPSGEVQTQIQLPDSLTTWVIRAYASTVETQVGSQEAALQVSKPLYIRAVTPRFFVAGDRVSLTGLVHNTSDQAMTVDVWIDVEAGLTLDDDGRRQIEVPARSRRSVTWTANVPRDGTPAVRITFGARSGAYEDVRRPDLETAASGGIPIYTYTASDVLGFSGALDGTTTRLETVIVPPEATSATALTVRIDPTLAAPLAQAMIDIPPVTSDSTEAWVSRFLPIIAGYRALQAGDSADTAEARLAVADTLDRLYTRQNADGGWGWWRDWSNLHMTTYVVFGLLEAQEAGFEIRSGELHRGLDYIAKTLEQGLATELRYPHFALGLYVLSAAGQPWPQGAGAQIYAARDEIGVAGRAYLMMALSQVDASDTRIQTLEEELLALASIRGSRAHWEEIDPQAWTTDVQATAVALTALTQVDPDQALLAQVIRWLMTARQGERWLTQYETAWALTALSEYVVAHEAGAAYQWGLAINGVPLVVDASTGATPEGQTFYVAREGTTPALREDLNVIELARDGDAGRLYYTANLDLVLPLDRLEPESRGITLMRQYCLPDAGAPDAMTLDSMMAMAEKPVCQPQQRLAVGDLVEVRLTVAVPETRYFVQVVDPYPAGFDPFDPTLLTTPKQDGGPLPQPVRGEPSISPRFSFEYRDLRDDRAVFAVRELSGGTYQISYLLRATVPGLYQALPAVASERYFPEVWGRTDADMLEVIPLGGE